VILLCATVLIVVGIATTVGSAAVTVRENAHGLAVFASLGFTPRQIVTAAVVRQASAAAVALATGVPFGLALFHLAYRTASGTTAGAHSPSAEALLALGGAALAVPAVLAVFFTAAEIRRPVAFRLRAS
jgi:hypothetical protein